MKTFLLVLVFVLFPIFCFAAPFLVCDPQVNVDNYILEVNGVETPEFGAETDGSMKYDLAEFVEGDFTVKAKAGNIWGWSDWSVPFSFTKALPQNPMGLRVSLE